MTTKNKKRVLTSVVVLLAMSLWWGLMPKPEQPPQVTPPGPVEVVPEPAPEPAPVVASPEPPAPAPVPEPVAVPPAPVEPAPVAVETPPVPPAEPAPAPVELPPPPAPAAPAPLEAEASAPPLVLPEKIEPRKNKVSLSYRMGLNITADFKKLGGYGNPNDPGPDTGNASDRTYDDGYNRVDISGNAGDMTWYWGYTDPNSIQGDTIVLHHTSSPSTGVSADHDDGINHGFELAYQYEIHRNEEKQWRWGAEGAFGFTTLTIDDARIVRNEVNEITDTFDVPGGVFVLPQAPYYGTYAGPGPLISSALQSGDRVRTTLSRAATITGRRELDANIYLFRLGPYFEYPLGRDFTVFANAGLNLVLGDMDFAYTETVEYDGTVRATRQDSGSSTDFLVGGYVGAGLSYAINEEWSIFAGAQFQTAGRSVTEEGGKQAILDMSETVVVTIGVSFSF